MQLSYVALDGRDPNVLWSRLQVPYENPRERSMDALALLTWLALPNDALIFTASEQQRSAVEALALWVRAGVLL
jgi:hypothetical protein